MTSYLIVGGGPVGLFQACLLASAGERVTVLERESETRQASRSIGILPPALEALAEVGAAAPLLDCGVAISRAQVFTERRPRGSLSLERCPPPFRFVLSVPQAVTEALLAERLEALAPGSLRRGCEVRSLLLGGFSPMVELSDGSLLSGDFVIACDGRASTLRGSLAIPFDGRSHDAHYLMCDLPESTRLGSDAAIFVSRRGVVEAFPLPGGRRRWVAGMPGRPTAARLYRLRQAVEERTGLLLPDDPAGLVSAFTAETRLARRLAGARWALVGDAAHVVPPIGGQGMNLGLLGARQLARGLLGPGRWRPERYGAGQRRRARGAGRRAALNIALGACRLPPAVNELALRALLLPPAAGAAGRLFTMRGL